MPLIKITPRIKTNKAQFFELEGRHFAIVTAGPQVSLQDMEDARETLAAFLGMDVVIIGEGFEIDIVEALGPTRHERLAGDD